MIDAPKTYLNPPTGIKVNTIKKMPKIDTLDALEEHEEYDDDYQTNSN